MRLATCVAVLLAWEVWVLFLTLTQVFRHISGY